MALTKVRHETCQQYFQRRLSEGWKCISLEGHKAVLLSPWGFRRELDLRNDTLTIRPSADGDHIGLSPDDSVNWEMVDESGAGGDGDTTRNFLYNYLTGVDDYDLYALDDHTTESGDISKITAYACCKSTGAGDAYVKIKTGGTEYSGDKEDLTGSYVTYSHEWAQNPGNAHAWTWDEIDALQAGVRFDSGKDIGNYVTQVYVEVDYTPPVTGAAILSGVGTLAGIGRGIFIGKSTLSGVGTLAAIGRGILVGVAALAGTGSLGAIGQRITYGIATLAGVGTLVVGGVITAIGKATLSGVGTLAGIGRRIFTGVATLSGTGSLSVISQRICYGLATLIGVGTLIVRVILQPISNTGLRAMRQGESEREERKIFGQEQYTGGGWW